MSACEKCWSDAFEQGFYRGGSTAEIYRQLVDEREPCSPEAQAGPDAGQCPTCDRMTLHQHTGECMAGCMAVRYKNPAAVALGKLGASKGGKARAAKLSPERRRQIARQGGEARWANDKGGRHGRSEG